MNNENIKYFTILICNAECPELDSDNKKHCMCSKYRYEEIIKEQDFCPVGNKEIMIELDVQQ